MAAIAAVYVAGVSGGAGTLVVSGIGVQSGQVLSCRSAFHGRQMTAERGGEMRRRWNASGRLPQTMAVMESDKGEGFHPLAWLQRVLFNDAEKKEKELQDLTRNWHASTKGTLIRKFRVPNAVEGQRLLNALADLLSADDLFRDAKTHKGCRILRESAHGLSVCCNNVRGLFDELPTPHLEVEITVFPPGPLTSEEYQKAAKVEQVLKKGHSI